MDDDHWHTVRASRRGMTVSAAVDDDNKAVGECEAGFHYHMGPKMALSFIAATKRGQEEGRHWGHMLDT